MMENFHKADEFRD